MTAFGAGHWLAAGPGGGNAIRVISIGIGSGTLTYAAWRTRRLGPGIIGHSLNNCLAFLALLAR
jgi:membrane protease YdiL (CAAX protease family)